jgi:hypothetical protein
MILLTLLVIGILHNLTQDLEGLVCSTLGSSQNPLLVVLGAMLEDCCIFSIEKRHRLHNKVFPLLGTLVKAAP